MQQMKGIRGRVKGESKLDSMLESFKKITHIQLLFLYFFSTSFLIQ